MENIKTFDLGDEKLKDVSLKAFFSDDGTVFYKILNGSIYVYKIEIEGE